MDKKILYSKIQGALSGVAMGDAFGMPCEMWTRERIKKTYGYLDELYPGHPDNEISAGLQAGEVTDDTEFTMIISQLLIDNKGVIEPQKFVEKIKLWADTDEKSKTVLGPSTKRAINEIEEGQSIEYAGRMGESNGASMRILPVGIVTDYHNMESLAEHVRKTCLPTHNTGKAISGASAIAAAVSYAIRCGENPDDMIDTAVEAAILGSGMGFETCGPNVAKRIRYAVSIAKKANDDEKFMQYVYDMIGTGLPTVQTVPAALAIVYYSKGDPNICARLAANTGGDTDTIGAISCGIAGAYSGIEVFDNKILDKVISVNKLDIDIIAQKLLSFVIV